MDNEIPIGARNRLYRSFEALPAVINLGMLGCLVFLAMFFPLLAAWGVIAVVGIMFLRAIRSGVDIVRGYRRLRGATDVDWRRRLSDFDHPDVALMRGEGSAWGRFEADRHRHVLRQLAQDPSRYARPRDIYNAVIVAAYNEPYEVIEPTIRSLVRASVGRERMVIFFAYEERGGIEMARTVERLRQKYADEFLAFVPVCHPSDLPDELAGKGANITYAGHALAEWVRVRGIDPRHVLVTTLDCDNKPHPEYFACLTYRYVLDETGGRTSYQPISIFTGNIWDAPAPTRVVASGNTFWNIIASVRPKTLRNFASHSQPLSALIEMNFWSKRTIVEDGHQYWRSYFHFNGDYHINAIPVPIYQDAVLAETYASTLVAQFKQLSRWSYGASDVPYVAVRVFGPKRQAPFWPSLWRFLTLLDSQVTLGSVPIIIAIGGWLPILLAGSLVRRDGFVSDLPFVIGFFQQIAMIGLALSIVLAWRLLPPRPQHRGPGRNVGMVAQWVLFPLTGVVFNSCTALYSQCRLLLGMYRERFDVTAKAVAAPQRDQQVPSVGNILR